VIAPDAHRRSVNGPVAEGGSADGETRAETVVDPHRIAGLLSAITFPPLPLNVVLPGIHGLFTSALLHVNSGGRLLLLDRLTPDEGHARITRGSVLHVHGRVRGAQLDFSTRVIEIHAGDPPVGYLARMPGSIRTHQRRGDLRLRTGFAQEYALVELGPQAGRLRARLVDMSAGGLKIILLRDPGLVAGDVVTECRISLLGGEVLNCSLELVHVRLSSITGELEVGARFLRGEGHDEDCLQRLLAILERQPANDR
jgi:c-di-GMP-binding flagellar brake protein YcgR